MPRKQMKMSKLTRWRFEVHTGWHWRTCSEQWMDTRRAAEGCKVKQGSLNMSRPDSSWANNEGFWKLREEKEMTQVVQVPFYKNDNLSFYSQQQHKNLTAWLICYCRIWRIRNMDTSVACWLGSDSIREPVSKN